MKKKNSKRNIKNLDAIKKDILIENLNKQVMAKYLKSVADAYRQKKGEQT